MARYPITAEATVFTSDRMFPKLFLLVLSQMTGLELGIESGTGNQKYIRSHRNKRHGMKKVVCGIVMGLLVTDWSYMSGVIE